MTTGTPLPAEQPVGVHVVSDVRDLESFRAPACAATLWQRSIPAEVLAWLSQLDAASLPNARVVLDAKAVRKAVEDLFQDAGMPAGPHRDWLVADIEALAHRFADLMCVPYLRVRLQAVSTNACRKFHLDAITGRLVCTYRGTGTQYGSAVQGQDPEHIFTVSTGDPILLRGSLWPPTPSAGVLHRSPPIEGTGETRLILVLDPISDLSEAP